MPLLRKEEGAALVTALMLTALALVMSMALLYTITSGTRVTASQKRYRTALAAAHGGVELLALEIIPRLLQPSADRDGVNRDFSQVELQVSQYDCLMQKLVMPTAKWTACSDAQVSADPARSPDVVFRLKGYEQDNGFTVSAKIVDSLPGNSDAAGNDLLDTGLGVSGTEQITHPRHVPGMYNLSVQGAREGGSNREKANLAVLYAY